MITRLYPVFSRASRPGSIATVSNSLCISHGPVPRAPARLEPSIETCRFQYTNGWHDSYSSQCESRGIASETKLERGGATGSLSCTLRP